MISARTGAAIRIAACLCLCAFLLRATHTPKEVFERAVAALSAGVPSCMAGNIFLHPSGAHVARVLQLGAKFYF